MALEIPCPGCKATLRVREEYAGKQMKCPRCSTVIAVPTDPAPVGQPVAPVRPAVRTPPPPLPAAARGADDADRITVADGRPVAPASSPVTRLCPRCGETISATANRCRYCRAWLDEEDDDEDDDARHRPVASFKPCPRCGASNVERVTWTAWGSFYGPALFTHVRCLECGYGYNGRTGRSNLVPAIVMVAVPAILIVAIITGLLFVLGIFGGRRF
jgi:predicted RNA-binding Zn-ribbon protein involved in translation (DUF1610 family)